MGTNKNIIPKRQVKLDLIVKLLSKGNTPKKIMKKLKISRNQYYRDIDEIKKELFDPYRIKQNAIEILLQREYILTNSIRDYENSTEDKPARAVFSKIIKDVLNDKEKSYERLGLLNLEKVTDEEYSKELIKRTIQQISKYQTNVTINTIKETIENLKPVNKNIISDIDIEIAYINNGMMKNRKVK